MKLILPAMAVTTVAVLAVVIDRQSTFETTHAYQPDGPYRIYAPGRIEGVTPEIELRARLAGQVAELLVVEGQPVEADQVLLRLDDVSYRQNAASAAARVRLAEAELARLVNGAHPKEKLEAAAALRARMSRVEQARVRWERIQQLTAANAVAQQEADDASKTLESLEAEAQAARARLELLESPAREDELRIAEAKVLAAKAEHALANDQLEKTLLRAPTAGRVLAVNREVGEWTGPASADAAVVMVDDARLYVRAFVEELDAPRVAVGMPATIEVDGLQHENIRGRVVRLSPRMDRKQLWTDRPVERFDTKVREVWIELDESPAIDQLVVGLRVDVVIDPHPTENHPDTAETLSPGSPLGAAGGSEPPERPAHDPTSP